MLGEITKKIGKVKLVIIIIVLALILITISAFGYFLVSGNQMPDVPKIFESNKEYTILLDEFVVNLRSENSIKHYLKIQVALMYTNEKQGEIINTNVNKIRDVIIKDLCEKYAKDILDGDNIPNIKKEIADKVNAALEEDIIKDVYFTGLVIQ